MTSHSTAQNGDFRSKRPRRLVDDVWCRTCGCDHIAYIPVATFVCADCGFGAWSEDTSEHHATTFPDHVVYPLHHATEIR